MPYENPNLEPLPLDQIKDADKHVITEHFLNILMTSYDSIYRQLRGREETSRQILRKRINNARQPSYSELQQVYELSLDIWGRYMNDQGILSEVGLDMAAQVTDPDSYQTSLEASIAHRYELSDFQALTITSDAMWYLLVIRGLPEAITDT